MIGPRIAALRRDANLSQLELAQRLKISPSAVGMYEQGRREPALEVVVAMSEIFGVSTDYLLTGKGRDSAEEKNLSQMLLRRLEAVGLHLEERTQRPFSREELAVLFAAMLIEP